MNSLPIAGSKEENRNLAIYRIVMLLVLAGLAGWLLHLGKAQEVQWERTLNEIGTVVETPIPVAESLTGAVVEVAGEKISVIGFDLKRGERVKVSLTILPDDGWSRRRILFATKVQ